jgi:hypothetical protein
MPAMVLFGRRVLAVTGVVATALVVLAGSSARAEKTRPRVAIVELTIEGDAPPELRTQLDRSLAGGLASVGWEVISRESCMEALRDTPELMGCVSTTCLDRIGEIVGARRFVRARIEAQGDSFELELELLGADVDGGVIQRREGSCAVCTLTEANDAISEIAAQLSAEEKPPVKVAIATNPRGADLHVDGKEAGSSPADVMLPVGEHEVIARKKGYRMRRERFAVAARTDGSPQELTLDLERSTRFGVWKWVAAGTAAATIVTGAYLLAIDGNCVDSAPSGSTCKDLYDTSALGIGFTAVGVGVAGLAVWMFLSDRTSTEPSTTAIIPLRGGAYGVYTLTF